jgi:hypothetical protein
MTDPNNMRDLVLQYTPEAGPISEPARTMRRMLPEAATTMASAGMSTLPINAKLKAIQILPFQQAKRVSGRTSRLRWVLAACIFFVLSGVGVTLFALPALRGMTAIDTTQK